MLGVLELGGGRGLAQDFLGRCREGCDDIGRRACRREDAPPGQRLEIRKARLDRGLRTALIVAGALLLVTRGVKPQRIYREIDGSLLLMFAGLFVVVAGFERAVVTPDLVAGVARLGLDVPWRLALVTVVLSNLLSNVPAVLVLKPFVAGMADPAKAWLVVAMSSTLAGNLTLLGSVANLIVAEKAKAEGVEISFGTYLRVGLPITIVSLAFGTWWLS